MKQKLLQKSNHKLTEEACLVKMFKYFDIFDRGTVSFGDFLKTVEKIGLYYTPQELEPLFNEYDSDQSGHLDYKEFSAIIFGNRDTLKGQQIKRQPQNPNNNQE